MANKGLFIERNGTQRPAGLPSFGPEKLTPKDILVSGHPMEIIRSRIEEQCRRSRPKPMGKLAPCLPDLKVGECLSVELRKSRFTTFYEQFLEDRYFKKGKTGQIVPTHSIPSHVNNLNRTFGRANPPADPLYTTIMPQKSADQVNREYTDFHQGHIISNNHYFPSEQINRSYTKPFNRFDTFGVYQAADHSGSKMKKCMALSSDRLYVVTKPWMDCMERTKAPLGKKYEKYLDQVPDLNFGERQKQKCTMKMLLEDISPCEQDDTLINALAYLNQLRESLQKRNDFDMMDLIATLERIDKEHTGHLPLARILDIMYRLHIRVDAAKIRTMLSHFRMFIDEGCATERVNYDHFCRVLSVQQKLPDVGQIGTVPDNMQNKDTTYRQLTRDRLKQPVEGLVYTWQHRRPDQRDDANARVSEIIAPDLPTRIGLGASDFSCLRDKDQMDRIFGTTLSTEEFEAIWERLMADEKVKEQGGMASVAQFRAEMVKDKASTS